MMAGLSIVGCAAPTSASNAEHGTAAETIADLEGRAFIFHGQERIELGSDATTDSMNAIIFGRNGNVYTVNDPSGSDTEPGPHLSSYTYTVTDKTVHIALSSNFNWDLTLDGASLKSNGRSYTNTGDIAAYTRSYRCASGIGGPLTDCFTAIIVRGGEAYTIEAPSGSDTEPGARLDHYDATATATSLSIALDPQFDWEFTVEAAAIVDSSGSRYTRR
jgi:hypothetical protein